MRDVWPGNRNIYRRGSSGSSAIGFAAVPIVAVTSVDPEFPLSTLFGPLCYTWPHVAWTAAKWCGFYREQPQRWWVFRTRIKLSKENCDIFSLQFMHYITFVIGLRLLYVWSTVYRHLQTTRQQTRYSCPHGERKTGLDNGYVMLHRHRLKRIFLHMWLSKICKKYQNHYSRYIHLYIIF